MWREYPNLINAGQNYRALYMQTQMLFVFLTATHIAQKYREQQYSRERIVALT
jgi:hypothetical protein